MLARCSTQYCHFLRWTLVLALLGFVCVSASAQPLLGRKSAAADPAIELHVQVATRESINTYSGPHQKELRKIYEARDKQLLLTYTEARYLTDAYWQNWINGLLSRVAQANPALVSSSQRAQVGRLASINARCYGNDILVIDIGLISRLSTEDEIAFVLCHELAHQALDHVDQGMADYVDRLYSRETQAELRQLCKPYTGSYADCLAVTRTFACRRAE